MTTENVTKTDIVPECGPEVRCEAIASPVVDVEHHHHSWLGKHFCVRNFKRLGALGVVAFVLHILFHVVEVLLIPAILVWLGH